MTVEAAPIVPHPRFAELDVVRLRFDTADEDVIFKEGTRGTIVCVHEDDRFFEVEFSKPVSAVLTLGYLDVLPITDAA